MGYPALLEAFFWRTLAALPPTFARKKKILGRQSLPKPHHRVTRVTTKTPGALLVTPRGHLVSWWFEQRFLVIVLYNYNDCSCRVTSPAPAAARASAPRRRCWRMSRWPMWMYWPGPQ